MKLILKYIKPFSLLVVVSLAFLFCQAMTDLSLPTLMSDIVDTGISKSGIEEISPKEISENGYRLVTLFMNSDENKVFTDAYVQDKSQEDNIFYKLRDINDDELKKVDGIYGRAALAFFNWMRYNMAAAAEKYKEFQISQLTAQAESMGMTLNEFLEQNPDIAKNLNNDETQNGSDGNSTDFSNFSLGDIDITEFYQTIPLIEFAAKDSDLSKGIEESLTNANNSDSMLPDQIGNVFTQLFYREAGKDMAATQSSYIIKTGAIMLGVAFLGIVAAIIVGFIASKISANIGQKLRRDIFAKVESFSNSEFDKFSTASLITRTTNDVQQVQMLIGIGLKLMCYAPILGIGGIIMALRKSLSLSWIIAVAVITLIGFIIIVFSIALPKFKMLQKLVDKINLISRENLTGMLVIRAFSNEKYEEGRFDSANRDLAKTNQFIQRVMAMMMPVMTIIMNGVSLTIIWVGSHAIADSTLQIGSMMAFIQYAMQIIMSFLMIAVMFIMVPRASVSIVRISEVLNTKLTINDVDPVDTKHINDSEITVTFEDVFFRYTNAESDVLENISLTAKPGETTAFIGSTGSGKSTIINLIPRFYDVTNGSIRFNGIDIRDIPQEELRGVIGYVPQKGVLFSGDIQSNIKYGKEDALISEIDKAIEVAQAKDFVDGAEDGINTPIAQGGDNVSGGQKQRLSIARALIKKPPVYIFDDSFSALDFKTDVMLRKALKKYTNNATVFIVAQRISTIMNAEQIVVLDEGKIVGIGTHKELLKNCDTYREIAESQLAKEELA